MSRQRSRRGGYTLIEVMMAIGVLTAGAVGVMALQQAATRGNLEARQMTTGTQVASVWVERLRRDALHWTVPAASANPLLLARTNYLRFVPNVGTAPAWFVPAPPATSSDSAFFDFYGVDTNTAGQRSYCTNARLEWLYPGRVMRADVRVWWLRRESGAGTNPGRALLADCAVGTDPSTLTGNFGLRMVYLSTVIRYTPTPL
jgi:type IV pilus assembly protein PilV